MRTEVAQPAVFALSLALVEYALGLGLRAHAIAGHSLGEYTAAVVSGALDLEAGMLIVAERGRLMAQAQSERPGRMIAIIGLEVELVASICAQASTAGVAVVGNGERTVPDRRLRRSRGAGAGSGSRPARGCGGGHPAGGRRRIP